MKDEYPQRELSAAIIGAAMKVLNGLRPGLDEKNDHGLHGWRTDICSVRCPQRRMPGQTALGTASSADLVR